MLHVLVDSTVTNMGRVLIFEVVYNSFDVFIICTYVLSNKLFKM